MPKALLSVSDKTGLVDFGRGLQSLGWDLLASGGTARTLRAAGLIVTDVSEYTGSPEVLGGRVKTLHPAIHAGLLARATVEDLDEIQKMGWEPIDLVAVNLYPFEQTIARPEVTLEEAIENIDIGGVTLIRAAAKNFERVTLACDPADYPSILYELEHGGVSLETRRNLALKGFTQTARYDQAISTYLMGGDIFSLQAYPVQELRYGENPHQSAAVYSLQPGAGPLGGRLLQGKPLSYNNLLDLDSAWRAVVGYEGPTICIVKHLSPCGIASASTLAEAYEAALASDPVSAFGGVIASNQPFDTATAEKLKGLFVECIAAPGFTSNARELLSKKSSCRLLEMPDLQIEPDYEIRSIARGLLKQTIDRGDPEGTQWQVVSKRRPTEAEWESLRFAWKAVQYARSNAIVFAKGTATVGIGSGQPNRVDCVHIAAQRAGENARGAVMASDAYFPFPDSVEAAANYGITAVVHPGGSKRDAESIAAADEAGMAMVLTGVRHFRH
jgi:phosphoribosylaminoimidazolecarboxamide formyltransferase/IMP cyclohydrolase